MTYATVLVAVLLALCIARIFFLTRESRTLELASTKFKITVDSWASSSTRSTAVATTEIPTEIQEAQTEYEWAINARDSKRESRTIWLGAAFMLSIALVTAIIELSRNSY